MGKLEANSQYRMTRQRQVILEELKKVKTHPTADQIYEMVRKRLPRVSLGTVYRNLDVLSQRGMVQKLEMGGVQMRFDGDTGHHYHVRCVKCGQVDDVPADSVKKVDEVLPEKSEYEILGHRLEFVGICPACK